MRPPSARQQGSASILLLAVGLALVSIALGGQTVGAAMVARHRAALAADLGALAGALHVREGAAVACDRARSVVAGNGGELVGCTLVGADLVTTVAVLPAGPASLAGRATARARAGPVTV